jgi:hypothetical protein
MVEEKMNDTINVRDAKNQSKLPKKMRKLHLLGSYQGTLYIGSECANRFSDTIIYGYSLHDNAIRDSVKLKGGAWPESWTQKENLLFVGTRSGNVAAIDMSNCKQVGHLRGLGNCIDAIAVDEAVYFGVNGKGLYKSDIGLSGTKKREKKHVVSALALREDKLFAFYFSNGNDPILDGSPAGGLVEILDKDLEVLSEKNGTPYAVTQAININQGLRFSTRDVSNGWIEEGSGDLYELDPSDLSYKHLMRFPSAVNILRGDQEALLAGLKNGQIQRIEDKKKRVCASQEYEVTGLAICEEAIYVGSPRGQIHRIMN